jgi:homoserine/homoserine lactone efflux protein
VTLETWLLFCATEAVLCCTPGPAVLLVVSVSLTHGGAAGLRASFGILAANAAYFLLSATSLGAVLLASWELFSLIRWVGAAYLIWLGMGMIAAWWRTLPEPATPVSRAAAVPPRAQPFAQGFVTQASNPKLLLFFTAILPQFIDPHGAVAGQIGILGLSSIFIELGVLALYVGVCHRARGWTRRPRFAGLLQAAGGSLLVAAGLRLAALRRE